jgi:LmbE family N-acetylglucosaminyl deacetylase
MLPLQLGTEGRRLRVLCLGAHSDDIEIGCAGTLLRLQREGRKLEVTWAVLSADGRRSEEARRSAGAMLRGAASLEVVLGDLPDAHFPQEFGKAKAFVAALRKRSDPDVVFTHRLEDRHQDHRLVAELTWQSWRDHLILEYEIQKYEGDLGQPNFFVPLARREAARKVAHLMRHFATQRSRDWFSEDAFNALMRLRGIECRAPSGFAEAFHVRKALLQGA